MSYQESPGDVGAVGLVADPERADDGAEVNVLLGIKNQELVKTYNCGQQLEFHLETSTLSELTLNLSL